MNECINILNECMNILNECMNILNADSFEEFKSCGYMYEYIFCVHLKIRRRLTSILPAAFG
jgi:hypothetical protein